MNGSIFTSEQKLQNWPNGFAINLQVKIILLKLPSSKYALIRENIESPKIVTHKSNSDKFLSQRNNISENNLLILPNWLT